MARKQKHPMIGITLDREDPGGYSKFPWYAVRENYSQVVVKPGGIPIFLPHETHLAEYYTSKIDGLIITGGAFDINPTLYNDDELHESVHLKENRTNFELSLTQLALDRDIPVLGICGGQQLLNVVLGGTLIQHIPNQVKDPLLHEQPNPRNEPGHMVEITRGTLLHEIVGVTEMHINSAHHQAVAKVSSTTTINALAPDGVIEGIEAPQQKFCLGIQWHPEFEVDPNDIQIFSAFNDAASC